jgi:hypothetical protein
MVDFLTLMVIIQGVLLVLNIIDTDRQIKTLKNTLGRVIKDLVIHGELQFTEETKSQFILLDQLQKGRRHEKKTKG